MERVMRRESWHQKRRVVAQKLCLIMTHRMDENEPSAHQP